MEKNISQLIQSHKKYELIYTELSTKRQWFSIYTEFCEKQYLVSMCVQFLIYVHVENASGFHTMGVIASKVTFLASSNFIVLHLFVTRSTSTHILYLMLLHIFLCLVKE
jgi:hypothetical protein